MCEQTEINYLDGDIVWVKLGACWWPGQVTGFDNLPEDIQREFQKKPLIAAVKFFQEDTYEYVKNYQQIYKYNCTLKDEFIKKGLDKYRSKSKDGASYMDKFPGDVEMAEKLTGGDPDILNSEKFSPEEKPDISGLFGEKKIPKKKKDRDEHLQRRSEGGEIARKITHPRFVRESDHEVRIRHQPSSLPSTPNSISSPQYSCHLCNFTSSRVNVIICHIKSHRSGNTPVARSKVKTYSQSRGRTSDTDTPKRKYVRKEKTHVSKSKSDSGTESGKRKQSKQIEKVTKKKKTDPGLREILADWEDESEEETSFNQSGSFSTNSVSGATTEDTMDDSKENDEKKLADSPDPNEIIAETEKLLKETEKLSTIHTITDSLSSVQNSKSLELEIDKKSEPNKTTKSDAKTDPVNKSQKTVSDSESKNGTDKDDKKSRLSCFDFDEDDLPEPSIPPVRKIPRVFGEKSLSLKKEIIKEFEMSQALKTEQEKESDKEKDNDKLEESKEIKIEMSASKIAEVIGQDIVNWEKKETTDKPSIKNDVVQSDKHIQDEVSPPENDNPKSNNAACETEIEIVEILEVEREEGEEDRVSISKTSEKEMHVDNVEVAVVDKNETVKSDETDIEMKSVESKKSNSNNVIAESAVTPSSGNTKNNSSKELEETLSEHPTTETEDETISESADTLPEHSENSDADMIDSDKLRRSIPSAAKEIESEKPIKRKRGRPRKSVESVDRKSILTSKIIDKKKNFEAMEMERKTSESDTERSSSGRRRKPNKKYLESGIYVQDSEMSFKTDDSLSESDEKMIEKSKPKRRGRMPGVKRSIEMKPSDKNIERELELSDQLLDISEDSSKTDIETSESKIGKGKVFTGLEKKLVSNQTISVPEKSVETVETMETSSSTESIKKDVCLDPAKVLTAEETLTKLMKEQEPIKSDEILDEKMDTDKNGIIEEDKEMKEAPPSNSDVTDKIEHRPVEIPKTVEMLPPKKSQIKKFELSQIDISESDTTKKLVESVKHTEPIVEKSVGIEESKITEKIEVEPKVQEIVTKAESIEKVLDVKMTEEKGEKQELEKDVVVSTDKVQDEKKPEENIKQIIETVITEKPSESKSEQPEQIPKDATKLNDQSPSKRSSMQTRYKGKFTPETGSKIKKDKDLTEEKSTNTFQEAFLKSLQMDKKKADVEVTSKGKKVKKIKKKTDDQETIPATPQETKTENVDGKSEVIESIPNIQSQENLADISIMGAFEGVEVVVEGNVEIETKAEDTPQGSQSLTRPSESVTPSKPQTKVSTSKDINKITIVETRKQDDSPKVSTSTPSPDVSVPVKKREMPRIIENVTLTEPMQILKSKLLDKFPHRGVKHKLEESPKKGDQKGSPKAKIMKVETISGSSKSRTGLKVNSPHLSLTKKLQVLRAEEAETSALEAQSEKLNVQTTQAISIAATSGSEKCVQQSSQSLADMELDINSMPFVLSEDVLTPESIEQMPVVFSSIIPASSTMPATLSFTPTTQIVTANQAQYKLPSESTSETSPTKKKSGTPAILKNKSKAKPTITSIKTIVPPLTGGVKGLKFQSPPTGKTPPLLAQRGTPGKYVVVQATGGQQLRYSVQGKPAQQKIAIPASKGASSAQVVQQGGKVVILTSAQSGQTKMLPLNISKTLGGKVQRIMTSRGQVFCPISPQNIITSKTVIAPKTDANSPTTSKLATGRQINPQGIITSKGLLTPISGTIGKTALLGTLSQGIITKGGLYTPISASPLGGKTIIGPKTLVTKGTAILTSQNFGSSKAILTPVTQTVGGKIVNTQGIVTTKGTILTPITGQQVKAIAAKSPTKGSKVQYQSVQQKVQLPMLQKSMKIPLSTSAQTRTATSTKSTSGTLTIQNMASPKSSHQGKRSKQTMVHQTTTTQSLSSQSSTQHISTVTSSPGQHKGKNVSTIQKVIIPRGSGRQTKAQQKIVVQRLPETLSPVQSKHSKQTASPSTNISTITKSTHKHMISKPSSSQNLQQKNLLNMAMNSITTATSATLPSSTSLPPLEPIEPEKKTKIDTPATEGVQKELVKAEKVSVEKTTEPEKVEEPKVTTQPQIMALPTESSDGTQTYVLVTIDEQGQIQPLDNNTLMSLEGTTQNPDGTRTLYIDPSSLGEAGTLDNIILQIDNGVLPSAQTAVTEANQTIISENYPASEIIQTSNQDILAAALANTDFQQEISLPDNTAVMTTGLTQTSLINQTILQSTIIPPTEPISSPSVLETSLTLNQPIMTPLEVPSSLPIQSETTPTSVVSTIPSSLELPITITNPNISYISTGEAQIQIPGNSMPDIGEIMENPTEIAQTEISTSTQYLVIPNLEEGITVEAQGGSIPTVSYSVSIPNNIVLESNQVQTTPSMPIIDDTYTEGVPFTTSMPSSIEQSFVDVPVSEMLVSKAPVVSTSSAQSQDITVTSEMTITSQTAAPAEESIVSSNETQTLAEENILNSSNVQDVEMPLQVVYSSQDVPVTSELILQQPTVKDNATSDTTITLSEEIKNDDNIISMQVEQTVEPMTSSMPIIDETLVTSDSNKSTDAEKVNFETSTNANEMEATTSQEAEAIEKFEELSFKNKQEDSTSNVVAKEQPVTTDKTETVEEKHKTEEPMEVEEAPETEIYAGSSMKPEECQRDEPSSQGEITSDNLELHFNESNAEASNETPSQSYEQFDVPAASDSADLPSQSASTKSENSREPSQSIPYEPMETDEETVATEPPTQSFEHMKMNEASQSYETSAEASTNAPTQSFNEIMQNQDERTSLDESIDDQSFPTQSYEVGKVENLPENLETDAEISQEGNIPSQSNDIGADGIGTSSVSTNNSGLNEDETASSSYVPETPENQERDQDQESAISTSSYEIPPCEELNIASSSVIPDTSVRAEHTSIHDNGVPEIPTSSYNLNPDITSTHVDSVPTSSYEDQVIVEQNVSTSYEVPISMPGLEETSSQNFVTESTDHRNEPSSYYAHQEVTASYYESVDQESNSRMEEDTQEEVTPGYYERNPQEASQSYFTPEEATQSYSSHNMSPNYYDPRPETEASQSYYTTEDIEKGDQSSSQNIEASQSFYQERTDELRLRQQGEATPTYSERYPVDYTLENSPIDRHDLVESSVPATRPMER